MPLPLWLYYPALPLWQVVVSVGGEDDKVVPPDQAETMFRVMKGKGIPCAYVLFEGEGHGFRQAQNIERALNAELYFYSRVFGFSADCAGDAVRCARSRYSS